MGYLVVTAYNIQTLRKASYERALLMVGLYDGEHFQQPVPCPDCESSMFVMFNVFKEPEQAQCADCGKLYTVKFTNTCNFHLEWLSPRGF